MARTEGAGAGDTALTNRFSEPGTYLLEVRELTGVFPTNAPYRIDVRPHVAGFALSAEDNRFALAPGGETKLKIAADRFAYDGEIRLILEGDGVILDAGTIPEKKNEAEVVIRIPAQAAPGELRHFRLRGEGSNGFSTFVSTRPALRKGFPLMLNVPAELDGLFAIGTTKSP